MKKKRKYLICLDMDNVLADFDAGIGRVDYEWNPKEMYRPHFFYKLKPVRGAKSAVRKLLKLPNVQLAIASMPVIHLNCVQCATDKIRWLHKHFPALLDRICLVTNKDMVAGDFLVDDHITNPRVRDFPGELVYFNQREPCKSWRNVVKYLKEKTQSRRKK